ncbi:hypothetical protein ACHHYP_10672 [Achlya hypogyna]|uniref:Reverse transcriptase zinc-binding domain-containing protein n=1 Tax=Achlya hypogyna TaxID=1202772 RepID=A0A1V9YKS3_ACHHY|nr:hypothetical protein ACHHYP_10672 [Achlya hypogyna]
MLDHLKRAWAKAKSDMRRAKFEYEHAKAELDQHNLDTGFDRHANANEVATAHFLRKPPVLKVPITQATRGGVTTSDPAAVAAIFTDHWRRIMVTPTDAPPPDPALQAEVIGHVTAALSHEQTVDLDRSLESAEYQSDVIVGRFCAASGAALNKDKCITLALNEHDTPENRAIEGRRGFPSLKIAPPGTPIRYLGIYIGQGLARDYQAQLLNDKYLASFALWGARGRTIHGRRELATSVILSTVWYVTAVTPISATYLKVWQRVLNNFVVGAKTKATETYQPPLNKMWMHDKQLGLGVPHIASCIRSQRLRLLQKYMLALQKPTPPAWSVLVSEQFSNCMQTLMPIWLTSYHEFVDPSNKTAASLVSRYPSTRRWCMRGAGNGLRCLRDFLLNSCNQLQGHWPTFDAFHNAMSSGYAGAAVRLQGGALRLAPTRYATVIHAHFVRIYTTVRQRLNIRLDVSLANEPSAPHPFRMLFKGQAQPFELWPRRATVRMAQHGPIPTAVHPTYTDARPSHAAARTYMSQLKEALCWLTPAHANVWLRVAMKMLPTNTRYQYCRGEDPDRVLCSHGCGAEETIQHALRACHVVDPLWRLHQAAWSTVGVKFTWYAITNIDQFGVTVVGAPLKHALYRLWVMLTGVTLHLAWQTRNNAKHRGQAPPPTHVLLNLAFVTWTTTVRRWIRLQDADDSDLAAVKTAMTLLLRQAHYRDLYAKHPWCMQLDTVYDVA